MIVNKKRLKKQKNSARRAEPKAEPETIFRDEDQEYARVIKNLGGPRMQARTEDGRILTCHIRGNMSGRKKGRGAAPKRVVVAAGDIVLISIREFDETTADIIHKYSRNDVIKLQKAGHISADNVVNDDEIGFVFDKVDEIFEESDGYDSEDIFEIEDI